MFACVGLEVLDIALHQCVIHQVAHQFIAFFGEMQPVFLGESSLLPGLHRLQSPHDVVQVPHCCMMLLGHLHKSLFGNRAIGVDLVGDLFFGFVTMEAIVVGDEKQIDKAKKYLK